MSGRMKNTVLCTFLIVRKKLTTILVLEGVLTVGMILTKEFWRTEVNAFFGNDIVIAVVLLVWGMDFYERHTNFCVCNAVSLKGRIVSQSIVLAPLLMLLSMYDTVSSRRIMDVRVFSLPGFFRVATTGGFFEEDAAVPGMFELCAFYILVFAIGYLIGVIEQVRSRRFVLLVLLLLGITTCATLVIGSATWINPIAWVVGFIPSIMLSGMARTVVLYLAVAAAILVGAYRTSYVVKRNTAVAEG